MNTKSTTVEGKVVKVGDVVGFKCDIEQCGRIKDIVYRGRYAYLVLTGNFSGGYIGGQTETEERADDCWYIGL